MLTRPLMRVRSTPRGLTPSYVDPTQPRLLEDAEELLDVVQQAIRDGTTRGEIDATLDEMTADRSDHKLIKGIAKVLVDRTTFASECPVDPSAFRREVFVAARERGPLTRRPGSGAPVARDVLAEVGARHGLDVEGARDALYADLQESQRPVDCRVPDAPWLLNRYNVALAQSLLLYAVQVVVRLPEATPARMRQLLRWVRFHQLLAEAQTVERDLVLTFDGPVSLFQQSTRYGAQLARFLPALLLQEGDWSLEATVAWPQRDARRTFRVEARDGLVTHYADHGAWTPKPQTFFEERFAEGIADWSLEPGRELLPLGPHRLVFPDYTLVRGPHRVPLVWVGFWRKETLAPFLADLERYASRPVLVAVSKRLATSRELVEAPPNVLWFADVLSPRKVIEAAERLAAG